MASLSNILIFTDLDGTLLDHDTYSWSAALPALENAAEHGVPVIPCTSKTFDECLKAQRDIGLGGPFIFENGAGIALPKTLFRKPFQQDGAELEGFWLCSLGVPYAKIRHALMGLRQVKHYQFRGFGDMTTEQISDCTGLDRHSAQLANLRRFSEPLLWLDNAKSFDAFAQDIEQLGLTLTRGGRFIHVAGPTDKGKAMVWLARRYEYKLGEKPRVIALGDSKNDLAMLTAADIAVIIRPLHNAPLELRPRGPQQQVLTTELIGPAGWNQAINSLLETETI